MKVQLNVQVRRPSIGFESVQRMQFWLKHNSSFSQNQWQDSDPLGLEDHRSRTLAREFQLLLNLGLLEAVPSAERVESIRTNLVKRISDREQRLAELQQQVRQQLAGLTAEAQLLLMTNNSEFQRLLGQCQTVHHQLHQLRQDAESESAMLQRCQTPKQFRVSALGQQLVQDCEVTIRIAQPASA